jgi:signal transduction histidine kinase
VAIPLLSNDELVAVLMAESRNFCVYDQADENFLITLAQPLAVSIQNSMLYDSMEKKIKERTAELQHLNSTKDKFFSIISHDLRGPVTSFQSLTRLFSHYNQEGESDKIESLCSKVDQSVETLNHLLENLLDWSLSQTNGIQCSFEIIPLLEFLRNIGEIYQPNLNAKEIDLNVDFDKSISIRVDRHTLATVFRNLISNSIKFTPRKGSICITAAEEGEKVRVELRDTGVGIDCTRLINVFQLQGQRSYGTEKEKGTGLGLLLVKEFTELNDGTITIESDPGKGTLVTLLLPNGKRAQ